MAEEDASFLAVVPAREQELPEPSQPAKPEAVSLDGDSSEAIATVPPSVALVRVQPEEVDSKAQSEVRPKRAKPRKADAKPGTRTNAEGKTSGKSKRGKPAGPKSKGSRRKDQ